VRLRPFVRAAPFVIGAVAAGVWLHHRRRLERPALRQETGEMPPLVPPERPDSAPVVRRRVDIVTIVDDLLAGAR
jgi:hypothetical protein